MCEKLGHWRDLNPRPPYPRRRVSILVTNVLTTRPQKPLILLQRQITNIHTLPFLSSFVLGVLVIFKPQVCIVSTAQVHIPSRYTHTKCSPFWSDVPTCTFFKLTCFIDSSHIPLWLCLIGFRNDYWIFEVGRFCYFIYLKIENELRNI